MNGPADFDISLILSAFYRRKNLVIAFALVVFLLAAYVAAIAPNVYRSSTLVLITPQKLPASFVTSTVTTDLGERMQSIIQEILSRTQLEKVANEFNLYSSGDSSGSITEDRVERLRKAIKVEFRRNNVFQLSFESENPEKAKQVAGRVASLFIDQNLQVREQQAIGTKSFINAETERLRKDLDEQETVVNQYKAAHRYELPDQLDTNLRNMEQYRRELEGVNQRLAALQERKGVLQKQVVESDILGVDLFGGSFAGPTETGTPDVQIQMREKELDLLLQKYSAKHPDVIRVKKEIQALEADSKSPAPAKSANFKPGPTGNPMKQVLQTQITDIDAEVHALRAQQDQIRNQVGVLQGRIENTPIRTIELSKISRGYEITLRKYQDLLAKGLESDVSENMEKKQKGEQFQILDPANFPLKPVRPNRPLIILIGLLAGLGGGFGLAFLWDNLDSSFKRGDEINSYVNVPLLATIPALMTRGSVLEQRRSQGLLVLASLAVLVVGLVCVRAFGPMYF
jgi:protein tyrosine kinase modulator